MSYRITNGDKLITTQVLKELIRQYGEKLDIELKSKQYEYDIDCPSYFEYQSLVDSLVVLENHETEN